jgi:hypothetical protein
MKKIHRIAFWIAAGAVSFVVLAVSAFSQVTPSTKIHVTEFSKTGPQQQTIVNVMNFIKTHADDKCAAWFPSLQAGIAALEGDGVTSDIVLIGHGVFSPNSVVAITGNNPKQADLPSGVVMTFNNTGLFFFKLPNFSVSGYEGGTSELQVLTVIHELGHFLNTPGIIDDFGQQKLVEQNNEAVKVNCGRTIKAAKKEKF